MLKKIIVCLLIVSNFILAKDVNISFIRHGSDSSSFWAIVENGVNDAKNETGANVTILNSSNGDLHEMAKLIKQEVNRGVDAIVLSIPSREILGDAVKSIAKAGIPFITMNAGGDFGKRFGSLMHVGQSEYEAGYLAGKRARKVGVKSFVCLNKNLNHIGLERRCQGFADALVVDNNMIGIDSKDPASTEEKVKNLIGKVDAILLTNASAAAPVIKALASSNAKHTYFVTFDVSKTVLNGIKNGIIDFTIDQQQYLQGYFPIIVLNKMLKYGLIPSGDINSGPGFITKDNYKIVEKYSGKYR